MNINSTTPAYSSSIFQQQTVQKSGGQTVGQPVQPAQQVQETQQAQQEAKLAQPKNIASQSTEASTGTQAAAGGSTLDVYA